MKYEFTQFETNAYGEETGNKITTSFHADTLEDIIERMHYFLKGSGFYFDGNLDIVTEEDSNLETFKINLDNDNDISINLGGGGPDSSHSPYYYESDRNKPFPYSMGSNDWDNEEHHSSFNLDLNGDFEIKLDSSNIYFDYNNTMAGYPSER